MNALIKPNIIKDKKTALLIHEKLSEEDNRGPAYARVGHDHPELLSLKSVDLYAHSASVLQYIKGARLFDNFVDQLSIHDGERCLCVLMRPHGWCVDEDGIIL